MNNKFNNLLPEPSDKDFDSPQKVLKELEEAMNNKYDGHIVCSVATSSQITELKERILAFAFYLIFLKHDDYQFRLFEVIPINNNGSYPVQVNAFSGPMEEFGIAKDKSELEQIISDVLQSPRTRNIILSLY